MLAKMKVAIDARESGTSTGRYVDKLLEHMHLQKSEFEICVLTKPERVDFLKKLCPSFKIIESPYREFSLAEQIGFKKQLNSLAADLVHFGMTQQPVRYRGRSVTTIHDLTTARFTNPAKNRLIFKLKQLVYRWLIKKSAVKSLKIIVPSRFVKSDVANFTGVSGQKIEVIYEAADRITAKPEPVKQLAGQKFIMYVGRSLPHKNLIKLVDAFEIINEEESGLILVLAGKVDKNYLDLKKYLDSKNLTSQAIILGQVSDAQLRWLYENTQAYIFPSLSEGFGLPGLEAMVHSAPVVSSSATCLPEIYGDAAHYFDPTSADDIAQKIQAVLSDERLRQKLISAGRKKAAEYSWSDTAAKTLNVYSAVLSSAGD